jgi:hypothetical protein
VRQAAAAVPDEHDQIPETAQIDELETLIDWQNSNALTPNPSPRAGEGLWKSSAFSCSPSPLVGEGAGGWGKKICQSIS